MLCTIESLHRKLQHILPEYSKYTLTEYLPFLFPTDVKMEHQELSHAGKRWKLSQNTTTNHFKSLPMSDNKGQKGR